MRLDELDNWSSLGWAVLASSIIIGAAICLGRLVASRTLPDQAASTPLQLAVGINLLALVGLLLGAMAIPYPLAIVSALAVIAWLFTPGKLPIRNATALERVQGQLVFVSRVTPQFGTGPDVSVRLGRVDVPRRIAAEMDE